MNSRAFPLHPPTQDPHGCPGEGTAWLSTGLGDGLGSLGVAVLEEWAAAHGISVYHLLVDIGVVHADREDPPRMSTDGKAMTFTWPAA